MSSTWQANSASMNAGSSRRQAPAGGSSRPTITLDDWESRTPLAEDQLASISHVRRTRNQRPLPEKVRSFRRLVCCYLKRTLTSGECASRFQVRAVGHSCSGARTSLSPRHTRQRPTGRLVLALAHCALSRVAATFPTVDAVLFSCWRSARRRKSSPALVLGPFGLVNCGAERKPINRDASAVLRLVLGPDGLARARARRPLPRLPS